MKCPVCEFENIPGVDHCVECQSDLTAIDDASLDPIEKCFAEVRLRKLVRREPLKVAPTDSVESVVNQMATKGRPCALVVYEDVLVGIFTERDALSKLTAEFSELADKPVREFMTAAPEALGDDDCLAYAVNKMSIGGYRHIPITDPDQKPVGVVAVRDVLSCLFEAMPELVASGS